MTTLSELRERTRDWNQPMLWLAVAMTALTIVAIGGLIVDERTITGAPAWAKPFKFAVSIAIYAVTWSWLASLINMWKRTVRLLSAVLVAMLAVEIVIIVGQMLRGTTSHFNFTTALDAALFSIMGASIVTVWVGTFGLTVLLLRTGLRDTADKWAIRLGALVALAGLGLAFLMTGPTAQQLAAMKADQGTGILGAHSVGVPDGGPGLPILGWSTTGGDLRIPHFIGMHALQVLPLFALALGLLATRWPRLRSELVRTRLVFTAVGGYAGLVALVTWQALRGQSLIHPDALTLLALTALVAAVGAGALFALRWGHPAASTVETPVKVGAR